MKKLKASLQNATAHELKVLLKLYKNSSYLNPIKGEFLRLLLASQTFNLEEISGKLEITAAKAVRISVWLQIDVEWVIGKSREFGVLREIDAPMEDLQYVRS